MKSNSQSKYDSFNIIIKIIKNIKVQRFFLIMVTAGISFLVIHDGAIPKRYDVKENKISNYDITAPRDVENTNLTEKNAIEASNKVTPVTEKIDSKVILQDYITFFDDVLGGRKEFSDEVSKIPNSSQTEVANYDKVYNETMKSYIEGLGIKLNSIKINLDSGQYEFLLSEKAVSTKEIESFKKDLLDIITEKLNEDITNDKVVEEKKYMSEKVAKIPSLKQNLLEIGYTLIDKLFEANVVVNSQKTEEMKKSIYEEMRKKHKIIVKSGERIVNKGDIVQSDEFEMLKQLDLIEKDKVDLKFSFSIFFIIMFLATILVIYTTSFCREIVKRMNLMVLLSVIVVLSIILARTTQYIGLSPLAIPIFIAPMLITLLIDIKVAIIVNTLLALAITLITSGDIGFLFMSLTSGTIAAFIVEKSEHRSRLSIGGVAIACLNVLIIIALGAINRSYNEMVTNSVIVFSNGIISTIFTVGTLQIWESTFHILTPIKLLELANPNHPLIKKLLMEAPGTYHHSLLVGNLAEVATELVNGNPLLSRVGAYYHDIGKIKRPNFFIENQYLENPHDKMTPNLSMLVLNSHVSDGLEYAKKYKIPQEIRDIIVQHHGTSMAVYFYVKAKKSCKPDSIRDEDFRYTGPRPNTKESAVIMLADCVEAAVRSMPDKTEGKIEGVVRRIIRDKLDDGQLDLSDLTLNDLDKIAKSFMRVLSGYFHQRSEYPKLERSKEYKESPV